MTVQQQIDSFIAGVKCAIAQTIIVNVSDDRTIRTSFEIYYNATASKLELALQLTNHNNEIRNVNQFNLSKNNTRTRIDEEMIIVILNVLQKMFLTWVYP